jgi:hypothetical protein
MVSDLAKYLVKTHESCVVGVIDEIERIGGVVDDSTDSSAEGLALVLLHVRIPNGHVPAFEVWLSPSWGAIFPDKGGGDA